MQRLKLATYVDVSDSLQANAVIGLVGSELDDEQAKEEIKTTTTTAAPASAKTESSAVEATTPKSDVTPAAPTVTDEEPDPLAKLKNLLKISAKLTDTEKLGAFIPMSDLDIRLRSTEIAGGITSMKGRFAEDWRKYNEDPNLNGAHETRENLRRYLGYLGSRAISSDPRQSGEVDNIVQTKNYAAQVRKVTGRHFRTQGSYFTFPESEDAQWEAIWRGWGINTVASAPTESVEVPTEAFDGEDWIDKDVTFVGEIYDTFPDPGRKNPVFVRANEIRLDSRVISVDVSANMHAFNPRNRKAPVEFGGPQSLSKRKLLANPIKLQFSVLSFRHNYGRRPLSYFDNLQKSKVIRRHCVRWNADLGTTGAWDPYGVTTVYSDDAIATCYATALGTFAIIAEIRDDPFEPGDDTWLQLTKAVGYFLSIVLLMLTVITICTSEVLRRDMFYTLTLNGAVSMLAGNFFMFLAEAEAIRNDRDSCCIVGLFINYFYVATASLLLVKAYAAFRAVTAGVIGGMTRVYQLLGWGLPLYAVGFNIYHHLALMGNDPRCMIGWEAAPKWTFFSPMILLALLALFTTMIILCNIHAPALRNENFVGELKSAASGQFAFSLYFLLVWSWAPLAYIDFPEMDLIEFYPAFQVVHCFTGIFAFLLLAMSGNAFRRVLAGQVQEKVIQLFVLLRFWGWLSRLLTPRYLQRTKLKDTIQQKYEEAMAKRNASRANNPPEDMTQN